MQAVEQKTHSTNSELKVLHYPWHPWQGKDVLTRKAAGQQAEFTYFCALPEATDAPLMAIPRWMFDEAICSAMHIIDGPFIDFATLHQLRRMLREQRAGWNTSVIQVQPSDQLNSGEADGNNRCSIAEQADGVICRAVTDSNLGGSNSPSQSPSPAPPGATPGAGPHSGRRRSPSTPRRRP